MGERVSGWARRRAPSRGARRVGLDSRRGTELAQAEANYKQARWDSDASTRLFERGLIAEQEARRAQSNEGA
jgi:hypothetical protein